MFQQRAHREWRERIKMKIKSFHCKMKLDYSVNVVRWLCDTFSKSRRACLLLYLSLSFSFFTLQQSGRKFGFSS